MAGSKFRVPRSGFVCWFRFPVRNCRCGVSRFAGTASPEPGKLHVERKSSHRNAAHEHGTRQPGTGKGPARHVDCYRNRMDKPDETLLSTVSTQNPALPGE